MSYICHMPANAKIHTYVAFAHPLAQIRAATELSEFSTAFVVDEWDGLYTDEADEDDVPTPRQVLTAMQQLGLRFESSGPDDPDEDSYWEYEFLGWDIDVLLYGWAYQLMDALALESRIFWHGLSGTELIFVPDYEGVVARAVGLLREAEDKSDSVVRRIAEEKKRLQGLYKKNKPRLKSLPRGEGPRETNPMMADRVAIAIREAGKAMTVEEVASAIGHKNAASVAAALHQIVAYQKPKRLEGWIARTDQGRYEWAGTHDDDDDLEIDEVKQATRPHPRPTPSE
jgi:hypothetical protein